MLATKEELNKLVGIIYIIKNKINWKRYIGQSLNTFYYRYTKKWWQYLSNDHFKYAIEKYGHENFEIEIILSNQTQNALDFWEIFYIDYFKSNKMEYGYNMTYGGKNGAEITKEVKYKIGKSNIMSKDYFIERARQKHGDKYDYSETEIIPLQSKVKIFCKKHNEFFYQNHNAHLSGKNCILCAREASNISKFMSKDDFIKKAKEKFQDDFEYNLINYERGMSKIEILHKRCGTRFSQQANLHVSKRMKFSCPRCAEIHKKHKNKK